MTGGPRRARLADLAALAACAAVAGCSAPPTRDWRSDGAGREYREEKLPKGPGVQPVEGKPGFVRTWGVELEAAREDADSYTVKVYRADPIERARERDRPAGASDDAVASSYRTRVASSRRLRFVPFDEGLPRSGEWRQGFAVADANGDGHPDLVHGPPRRGPPVPVIFLGDGAGRWRRFDEARFPAFPFGYGDVSAADLDGDGRVDLALAVHGRGLVALVQRAPGEFALWNEGLDFRAPGAGSAGLSFSSRAVAAADLGSDGRPEIVALGEGPSLAVGPRPAPSAGSYGLAVYANLGEGRWRRRELGSDRDGLFGDQVSVADVDGDGLLDVLASSSVQGRRDVLRRGRADGSFQATEVDGMRPTSRRTRAPSIRRSCRSAWGRSASAWEARSSPCRSSRAGSF